MPKKNMGASPEKAIVKKNAMRYIYPDDKQGLTKKGCITYPVFVHVEPLHEREDVTGGPSAEAEREEAVAYAWVAAFKAVVHNRCNSRADEPRPCLTTSERDLGSDNNRTYHPIPI